MRALILFAGSLHWSKTFLRIAQFFWSILTVNLCAYATWVIIVGRSGLEIRWLKPLHRKAELSEPVADLIVFEGFKAWKNGWNSAKLRRKCVPFVGFSTVLTVLHQHTDSLVSPEISWSFLGFVGENHVILGTTHAACRPSGARRSWQSWTSSSGSGWRSRWPDRIRICWSVLSGYVYGPWVWTSHLLHEIQPVAGHLDSTLIAPWYSHGLVFALGRFHR